MLHVLVHEANIQDHNGGRLLLAPLVGCFPRLKLIWADSAYKKGGESRVGQRDPRLGRRDRRTSPFAACEASGLRKMR